jgi:hypothetical protein
LIHVLFSSDNVTLAGGWRQFAPGRKKYLRHALETLPRPAGTTNGASLAKKVMVSGRR